MLADKVKQTDIRAEDRDEDDVAPSAGAISSTFVVPNDFFELEAIGIRFPDPPSSRTTLHSLVVALIH